MPASKRHVNWSGVAFTPTAASAINITGVQNVEINPNGNLLEHSGDADRMPTTIINDYQDPEISVTHRDLNAQHSLPPGTRGAFAATHNDAKNGTTTGGGAYAVALSNAIIANNPGGGGHRQWGEGTLSMKAESTDGITSPLAFTSV
jgi:hypothetical protein